MSSSEPVIPDFVLDLGGDLHIRMQDIDCEVKQNLKTGTGQCWISDEEKIGGIQTTLQKLTRGPEFGAESSEGHASRSDLPVVFTSSPALGKRGGRRRQAGHKQQRKQVLFSLSFIYLRHCSSPWSSHTHGTHTYTRPLLTSRLDIAFFCNTQT